MPSRLALASLATFVVPMVTGAAGAQRPAVGAAAPAVVAADWLNWDGAPPTLESCKGRVVLLEFWGTWCGPCVRAMPAIQKLHERYRDRGLTVLAISYEPRATMAPFLREHGYTMPVGADVEKKTVGAYGIRSWPTTVVVDKAGNVAHVGSPYDAEAAVEKALGLEAGPVAVLDQWLASQTATDKAAKRQAFERLAEKAPPDFDLRAWALAHVPAETVGDAPAAPGAPGAAEPGAKTARPAAAKGPPVTNPADVLRRCAQAWHDEARREPWLRQLADSGPTAFDLAAFAQQAFAKAFPLDAAELKALLADEKYGMVLDAIAQRAPAASVLAAATKHADFVRWCKGKTAETRAMARKGLIAQRWLFANALPRDEKVSDALQRDLAASGFATSEDRKSIVGVLLGGEQVHKDHVAGYIRDQFARAAMMDDLASGKPPRVKELPKLVDEATDDVIRELEGKYGKPEPFVPKPGK